MGIPVWKLRDYSYFVGVCEIITPEKQHLLDRMMVALHWPVDKILQLQLKGLSNTTLQKKIDHYQPRMVLLFKELSKDEILTGNFLYLPTIAELMKNKEAKKETWARLQPWINHSV